MTDREAFEQWGLSQGGPWLPSSYHRRPGTDEYYYTDVAYCWMGWQAALAYARQVPDGFKLVPVEPTEEMLRLGEKELGLIDTRWDEAPIWDVWNAMITAATSGKEGVC